MVSTLQAEKLTAPKLSNGWLRLEPHLRRDRVAAALAQEGILVSTADAFAIDGNPPQALRLALSEPPLEELPAVLRRLRAVLDAFPL